MMDQPFVFDQDLLDACAESELVRLFVNDHGPHRDGSDEDYLSSLEEPDTNTAVLDRSDSASCLRLFQEHAAHYGRTSGGDERQVQRSDENGLHLAPRLRNFLKSIVLVYRHKQSAGLMKLSLNGFSDLDFSELVDQSVVRSSSLERHLRGSQMMSWEALAELTDGNQSMDIGILTELSSMASILHVTADLGIGRGSMNVLRPKKKGYKSLPKKDFQSNNKIRIPSAGAPVIFQTADVSDPNYDGNLLSIKRKKQSREAADGQEDDKQDSPNPEENGDAFATSINWATTNNPDGVSLVHAPIDQGMCGSCWALAATGSLEASAARREANDAFQDALAKSYDNFTNGTTLEKSIEYAREVEKESFMELDLSVQELIDCDQSADQGCTGGNPLLAFYFIHRYGLTTTANYPYVGAEGTCHKDLVKSPIATVQSWGIISPNHEDHMALVLRYIGPIAVGLNGADPAFRSYSGGIFDHAHCKQGANHALLITGYDQETLPNGTIVRYWIARNSWGSGWGINGYVKMIRGDGLKGTPGICGIARSPSVALGGQRLYGDRAKRFAIPGYAEDRGPLSDFCFRVGLGMNLKCIYATTWIDGHMAYTLGAISIACTFVAVWVLSRAARRRWRRRERQREQRRAQGRQSKPPATSKDGESAALLANNPNVNSYGSE